MRTRVIDNGRRIQKGTDMDLQLAGKRALVTGSTAGIGFATAAALYREGASVVINGRTPARVEEAAAKIKRLPTIGAPVVSGIAADLATAEGAAIVGRQAPEVDILINNMGIFEPKPFAEISDADWFRFFEANVMSGVRMTRHYLPGMRQRNWGRIVFVSSESGVQIPTEMIHYGMTKTAQLAIARGVAETTAGTGITVNSVLPGPTESEGVATFVADLARQGGVDASQVEAQFFKTGRPSSLLQRFATVDEVANMIVYVCSPLSSATNGAALRVDGGVVRAIV
jgi:NAD(P)-dependent dehydrogenase (short-subunit alcohol dehydrogenase family)